MQYYFNMIMCKTNSIIFVSFLMPPPDILSFCSEEEACITEDGDHPSASFQKVVPKRGRRIQMYCNTIINLNEICKIKGLSYKNGSFDEVLWINCFHQIYWCNCQHHYLTSSCPPIYY